MIVDTRVPTLIGNIILPERKGGKGGRDWRKRSTGWRDGGMERGRDGGMERGRDGGMKGRVN